MITNGIIILSLALIGLMGCKSVIVEPGMAERREIAVQVEDVNILKQKDYATLSKNYEINPKKERFIAVTVSVQNRSDRKVRIQWNKIALEPGPVYRDEKTGNKIPTCFPVSRNVEFWSTATLQTPP